MKNEKGVMKCCRGNLVWLSALLFILQPVFSQPASPPVRVDWYSKVIGRITVQCSTRTAELNQDWQGALAELKLSQGLILDLREMKAPAEEQIPALLGYFFDLSSMSAEDAAGYREFLNGINPYTNPLLLMISDEASPETVEAAELFMESRPNTELTTCDLECRKSRGPLWRFKAHIDRIRLRQQERMEMMLESRNEMPSPQPATPQATPKNK